MLLATASITAISTPALTFNCKKSLMEIKIINKFIQLKLHKILVKSINVHKSLVGIYMSMKYAIANVQVVVFTDNN